MRRFLYLIAVLLCWPPHIAVAQDVPSTADPARVHRHITPDMLPPPPAEEERAVEEEASPVTPVPDGAEDIVFPLSGIALQGATAYTEEELAPLYAGLIGREVSLAEIFALADRITVKYRNDGYILSRAIIPAQEIEDGIVTLLVVEGYIDALTIEGGRARTQERLRAMLAPVLQSVPLRMADLENALLLTRDLPGITVRNIIRPSETAFGAADLHLIVTEETDFGGQIQADNRGSRYVGPLQISALAQTGNLFGRHDRLSLQAVTALHSRDDRELDYLGLFYSEPLGGRGTTFFLSGSLSFTEPGLTLSQFDIRGKSRNFGMGITHPLIRTRGTHLNISAQFDAVNTQRRDNISTDITRDRLRVLRAGLNGHHYDGFSGVTAGQLQFSKGMDVFGATESGTPNMTRPRGRSDFFKLTGQVSRLQRVTDNIQFFGALTGQKSAHMLLSSEEFGIGGANFGRAYDSSEITGEDGFAVKAELRRLDPVQIDGIRHSQIYAFYDIGKTFDRDSNILRDRKRSLASAGIGFSATAARNISFSAEIAKPLTRDVAVKNNRKPRGFFTLTVPF